MSRKINVEDVDALVDCILVKLNDKFKEIKSVVNSPDTSPQSKVVLGAAMGAIAEISKVIRPAWLEVKSKMPKDNEMEFVLNTAVVPCPVKAPKVEKPKLELTPAQAAALGRRDNKGHFAPKQKHVTGEAADAAKTEGNA